MTAAPFGETPDGEPVSLFTLENTHGMRVRLMNYGGIVLSIEVPDSSGQRTDVALGLDTLDDYVAGHPHFGALCGRYANRIRGARFMLDGVEHRVDPNLGEHHLHGGSQGFDRAVWQAEGDDRAVTLRHVSPEGDQGYPGALATEVTYSLEESDALRIDYVATTEAPTVLNLTHHTYFNLGGHDSGSILDHELWIDAHSFTPVDEAVAPSGEVRSVEGTPFDFLRAKPIGRDIGANDEQLRFGSGYDHNFVLGGEPGTLRLVARATDPRSGRTLALETTEPGVQLYTGNHLEGISGKGGARYGARAGFCLEAQHFPDSPNIAGFPSTVLRPGERYRQTTRYRLQSGR